MARHQPRQAYVPLRHAHRLDPTDPIAGTLVAEVRTILGLAQPKS